MTILIGPLLNTFLSLSIGACIRCYPLRDKLRVSLKSLAGIYALVFLLQCVVFVSFREYFAANYLGNQVFKALTGVLYMLIPFIAARGSIFQNLFLISVVAHYIIVIFGAGNFIELTWGGAFAQKYPYLICDGAVMLLSVPILPLTLKALSHLFGLLPGGKALVWKYIWIIPTLFAVLCMMAANIFMGEDAVGAIFVVGRIFIGAGMIVTCFLLARTLRQTSESAALEHKNQMKTELLQNMSHEMKTPLTVISTNVINADTQLDFEMNKEDMRKSLRNAQQEIMRMSRMVESALKYSSIQEADQHMEPLDIASLLRVGAEIYRAIVERRGNTFILDIPERLPDVFGNADMLLQVLSNLLSNSNRHTQGGEISISAAALNDTVTVAVCDNGEGVKPDILPQAFKRGVSTAGGGLGLSICKSVIEKHGGQITIESEYGKGTIVTFSLPVHTDEGENNFE